MFDPLTVSDLKDRNVQKEYFPDEFWKLLNGLSVDRKSKLYQLNPNGVPRMKGRTIYSTELNINAKQPIILSSKHPYTDLLIMHYHERANHHG